MTCPRPDQTDDPEAPLALAARVSSLAAGPLALAGHLQVQPTACGVVAALSCAEDAERLLTADLSGLLGEPVHVTRLVGCKRTVLLPDVPRAIPVRDITAALQKQGISALSVERHRHLVHVELQDVAQSNALLRDGLDFFGAVRFRAVSERAGAGYWWRRDAAVTGTTTSPPTPSPRAGEHPEGGGRGAVDVLQCYRCQGFWHVAGHCRHIPRCVRCGEPHTVEFCPRPRHDPICCHCAGPHHAAFRECPVRRQLLNAIPISISMTTSGRGIDSGRLDDSS
ncbi:uncharacterized protein LOC127751215 [Frankliniella occidentalis]|uniref:Uncharacterized protein LOC127751215 n=1 Tax=Frankliniella occidentalis TaxID=133901 RepID=A0A9C6X6Z6_FRAOC|nr:uncharacterized protein LOC127751215 [Frankliniella occidentalis]